MDTSKQKTEIKVNGAIDAISYVLAVANRIMNIFVFGPACGAVIIFGVLYSFSFHTAALDIYTNIEAIARDQNNVPAGHLGFYECKTQPLSENRPTIQPCEESVFKEYSVTELANQAGSEWSKWYWIFVIIGFMSGLLVKGPRRFFMLDESIKSSEKTETSK